jgi:hypothetical protein
VGNVIQKQEHVFVNLVIIPLIVAKYAVNCSTTGGTCDSTGKCICNPGYYSPDCSKTCQTCSSPGGICDLTGKCLCGFDYYGDSCDVKCVKTGGTYNTETGKCVCDTGYFKSDCSINCTGGTYDDKLEKCVITNTVTNTQWPPDPNNIFCTRPCNYSIKLPEDYGSIVSFVASITLAVFRNYPNSCHASVTLNQTNSVTIVTDLIDNNEEHNQSLNIPLYPQWNGTTSIDLSVYISKPGSSILMEYISYTLQYYKKN